MMLQATNQKHTLLIGSLILIAALSIGGITLARSEKYPSGTWRYKVTVNVDTPEGLKSGSAVREVTITRGISLPESSPSKESRGEAVVVDLGKRGLLFALTSFDDYQIVFKVFPYDGGGTTPAGIAYYSRLKTNETDVGMNFPKLVRFGNLNDPKTVEIVNPYNLAASFGEGVSLRSITIQMTSKPISTGVASVLPWFETYKAMGQRLNGKTGAIFTNELADNIGTGDFSEGIK